MHVNNFARKLAFCNCERIIRLEILRETKMSIQSINPTFEPTEIIRLRLSMMPDAERVAFIEQTAQDLQNLENRVDSDDHEKAKNQAQEWAGKFTEFANGCNAKPLYMYFQVEDDGHQLTHAYMLQAFRSIPDGKFAENIDLRNLDKDTDRVPVFELDQARLIAIPLRYQSEAQNGTEGHDGEIFAIQYVAELIPPPAPAHRGLGRGLLRLVAR